MNRADIARCCAWVVFVLAGMVWIATRYRNNWYYYDEWSAIDRSLGSWAKIFDGHQGHLVFENYIVYRLQRAWFGLQGHQLVWLGFMGSLAAFQIGVAALLRRLGLPTLLALLAATVITYFGPGSQNMVWEFQQNINLALALCFVAGVIALRTAKTQPAAIAIGVVLAAAVVNDSGLALVGLIYVGVLVALLWPRRLAIVALAPPVITWLAWFTFGDQGPHYSAPFDKVFTFAWRLFFLSAGSLVGGGETPSPLGGPPTAPTIPLSGVKVGLLVLVFAGGCVAFGLVRHRLSRPVIASVIGGVAAAVVGVSIVAWTRAFLIVPYQFPGSRYVQWTAVFLLLAFAPVLATVLRPTTERAARVAGAIAGVALVGIFVMNLNQLRPTRQFNEGWSAEVKLWVGEAVTVLSTGCGEGKRLDPDATPTLVPSPQVTVALVRELLDDGALTPRFGVPVRPQSKHDLCRPARS